MFLWLATVLMPIPQAKAGTITQKNKDQTSLSIAKASTYAGVLNEEESSRAFFSGKIKTLPSGLPLQECWQNSVPHRAVLNNRAADFLPPTNLKHHIEQLLFPFHFFY